MAAGSIQVRFWGVRGSVPSPGPQTVRYGGNTPCVSIEATHVDGTDWVGVLDAGTGIRALGRYLAQGDASILIALTHTHWDHIQGFPFFAPLYQPQRTLLLSRNEWKKGLFRLLLEQMDGQRFPLTQEDIQSRLDSYSKNWMQKQKRLGYQVQRLRVNHPGLTYAFRIVLRGATVIYMPDNEIEPPGAPWVSFDALAAFCRGADLLIHDAQYVEADMPHKHGWGHSVISHVWPLARAAEVKHLILFHHDPDRSDAELDVIQEESERWFRQHAPQIRCTVAYEGLSLSLPTEAAMEG